MRHPYFFLLLSVFLLLYGLINGYIFLHGWNMLEAFSLSRGSYIITFLGLSLAYIIGELLQQKKSSVVSDVLMTFGSLWFVGIVHFFFVSLFYDGALLLSKITVFSFDQDIVSYHLTRITVIITLITICLGYINARNPVIHKHTINIKKKNAVAKNLTVAVASDIHLGPTNGIHHIERIVKKINSLKPDLILLPGDIIDGELGPVMRRDIGKYLKKFRATYGVYGIVGNHEYIGGIDRAKKYITDHHVHLLIDEVVEVAGITLIGRDDIAGERVGMQREKLSELVKKTHKNSCLILLDHQPKDLSEAQKNGIDIQFSGHTHNGQLWPLNYIVKKLFEVPYGYKKKGHTHIFVSPGVGTWGPPVRTNVRPEILCVKVEFL